MYHQEFLSYLERATPRVALLYGEPFYIDHYTNEILRRYAQAEQYRYYFNDYDFKAVLEVLSQDSLFGEGSVVLLKLDKKLGNKEITALLEAVATCSKSALIIGFYPLNKNTYIQECKQFSAQLKHPKLTETLVEVRFFPPKSSEFLELLQKRAQALKVIVDSQTLFLLLEYNDVGIAYQELEKLALLGRPITMADVQENMHGGGAVEIEKLFEALFERKGDSLAILNRLQQEGLDGVELVRVVGRYFYQLTLFAMHLKMHGSVQAREILGFNPPPAVSAQLRQRCTRLKAPIIIFEALRDWYVQSMRGDTEAGWRFLIKIQDYID
ncbi:DNA polymerase III subunit delta [Helicobacter cynogastricus]|uniref:DNA polymerase III subunit delta n=1 Tax=Helicobacter cynogastricus TaxID=329937 RepID=UPI001F44A521|nr:DNA polymerase III [Helicobacter cynogastricus]